MKQAVKIVLLSALYCGLVAPLVGGAVFMLALLVSSPPNLAEFMKWESLMVIGVSLGIAIMSIGPWAFLFGIVGGLLMVRAARRSGDRMFRRFRTQAALLGMLFGAMFALGFAVLYGPNGYTVQSLGFFTLLASTTGALCGVGAVSAFRRPLERLRPNIGS